MRMEFALAELGSWCIPNVLLHENSLVDCFRNSIGTNRDQITKYLKNNLPLIYDEWLEINSEIGAVNLERRYVVFVAHLKHFWVQFIILDFYF